VFHCINIKPVKRNLHGCPRTPIKVALRKRKKQWMEYVKNKSTERLSDYNSIRNYIVMSIKKDKAEYQKQLMRRMKRSDKMTEVRDKWRKYIHGVARTTLKSRAAKEQNRTRTFVIRHYQRPLLCCFTGFGDW